MRSGRIPLLADGQWLVQVQGTGDGFATLLL
jgi:hypothetical protein